MAMDLGYGINNISYANTSLRIVVLPSPDHDKPDHSGSEEPLLNSNCRKRPHPSQELCLPRKKQIPDEHEIETSTSKLVNVNSIILAGQSLFFCKMFTSGMKESQYDHIADIHIEASEEDAFMDLIQFMHRGKLSARAMSTPAALCEVYMMADKFDVPSCIRLCTELLISFPMTLELALLYIDRDSTGSMPDSIRPRLEDCAKNFLVERFKDMERDDLQEELLQLPLVGVEVVLSSHYLQIQSEDRIYEFIIKWVQKHYSDQLEERRKVLNMLVERFLRFPFLSSATMKDILTCTDIDPAIVSKLAVGALCYHQPAAQPPVDNFVRRAYKHHPLKVVAFDKSSSHPQCIVYLELKRDECENMFPDGTVMFQPFFLGKYEMSLFCSVENSKFGFYFTTWTPGALYEILVTCEIKIMKKPSERFKRIDKMRIAPDTGIPDGWYDLFEIPWAEFISKESPYFVNDMLRLRCHLSCE